MREIIESNASIKIEPVGSIIYLPCLRKDNVAKTLENTKGIAFILSPSASLEFKRHSFGYEVSGIKRDLKGTL
jgi:hypothetical protein